MPEAQSTENAFGEAEFEWIFKSSELQNSRDEYIDHVYRDAFLSDEECEFICSQHTKLDFNESRMAWGENETARRSTDLFWLEANESTYSIFQKISGLVAEVNRNHFQYELFGYIRPMQLGRYSETQGYDWHQDIGPGATSKRKLSVCVQLSDPNDFDGGEFELFRTGSEAFRCPKARGSAIVFPSWAVHRVTPITTGQRWSLVSWVEGPPLR